MQQLRYQLKPYLSYAQAITLGKHATVYNQGEVGRGFYYLEEGGVKILFLSENGQERIVDYVPVGTLLGEHGVSKSPYLTTAVCTVPSTLYLFSDQALTLMCNNHPETALFYTNSLIYKMRLLAEVIAIYDSPVEQQMAHYILKLRDVHQNGSIPIDQTSLAQYVGTSRITVNKTLQKWKQQQVIDFSTRGQIHVTNVDKLRDILAQGEFTQIL
ncbi:Crp/Fnr family transcriptional regulator [Paenibacillus sp. N1-5-1-14]|uniref:Crp/Fnr family transcriptional regulator n=1 Tax=Paenibacillus radicibacter TaxID=2972488 RepID=UPI002158DDBA|nr:Crp/Fnr family transcriptional regulator [Paenibacillus radicibacter]MCR8645752.1 Crp/Fnr family transcriptional regulator [Paenibacillus radicibacter]